MNVADLKIFIREGRIVWTITTQFYKYYTLNMITSLRDMAKVPWTLCVICCDAKSFLFFRREGIPCVEWKSEEHMSQKGIAAFGSLDFMKVNRIKIDILQWFTKNSIAAGIQKSLYVDGDIVFQRDPWPVLEDMWS